jgi:hypothetical protein
MHGWSSGPADARGAHGARIETGNALRAGARRAHGRRGGQRHRARLARGAPGIAPEEHDQSRQQRTIFLSLNSTQALRVVVSTRSPL